MGGDRKKARFERREVETQRALDRQANQTNEAIGEATRGFNERFDSNSLLNYVLITVTGTAASPVDTLLDSGTEAILVGTSNPTAITWEITGDTLSVRSLGDTQTARFMVF